MKIVFFGEALIEINQSAKYRTGGGDVANIALYVSRLGCSRSVSVSYATALGMDKYSLALFSQWQTEKIDTSLVRFFSTKFPDICYVESHPNDAIRRHFWNKDNACRYYFSSEPSPLEKTLHHYDVLYLSAVSFALLKEEAKAILLGVLEKFVHQGGKVFFDNRYRTHLWNTQQARYWISQLLPLIHTAFIDVDDEYKIWRSYHGIVERYRDAGCRELLLKQYHDQDIQAFETASLTMNVSCIQTALMPGDYLSDNAFIAGYVAERLSGKSPHAAITLGNVLARKVRNHSKAVIPIAVMRYM